MKFSLNVAELKQQIAKLFVIMLLITIGLNSLSANPKNGQTPSNNSSATADILLECV